MNNLNNTYQTPINHYQNPIGNSSNTTSIEQVPIGEVDRIADELVLEYSNPGWRKWYCGVIIEFGIEQVEIWRLRSEDARYPGKVFGKYVISQRNQNKELYG